MPTERATRITCSVTDGVLDSAAALEGALIAIERRSDARQVTSAWANIGECNRRLSHYLTGVYPDWRGGSLLTNTLDEAFHAYKSAEPGAEPAPVHAYLKELLGRDPGVVSFAEWARGEDVPELIFEPAHATRRKLSEQACVRWLLCARVLRLEDVAILHHDSVLSAPSPVPPRLHYTYLTSV